MQNSCSSSRSSSLTIHSEPVTVNHNKSEEITEINCNITTTAPTRAAAAALDENNNWKKWHGVLWSRWSNPEMYSISSSATAISQEEKDHHQHYITKKSQGDEENTLNGSSANVINEGETKKQALISLCKALMLYGAPCHRIEQALEHAAKSLSINATFIFIPGVMMMTFSSNSGSSGSNISNNQDEEKGGGLEEQIHTFDQSVQTVLIRCPQGLDMGKLTQVNDIIQGMCCETKTDNNKLSAQQGIESLERLFSSKPTWNCWLTLLSHTMCSLLTTPVMFNGSLLDTALSGVLGLLIGLLILLSERYTAYCNIFEISTTILVSFITKALNQWVCFTGVVLSATSVLIPGYTLTMSIMELSARHVITGTIRFVYSMIYALFIGYGLEIGTSLYDAFNADPSTKSTGFDVCSGSIPLWLNLALFPFMAISISINLGATMRQWPSMVCCSAIGFGVSVVISQVISNFQIVGTISAFAVGIFGNLYFKVTGHLALVPLSCGIVSLVPGSVGIQGAYFLIRQVDQGMSFATQMVVASLGISVGLFAATLAVSPNERKKSAYLSY